MSRLTFKNNSGIYHEKSAQGIQLREVNQKLGQLEDIEEELGVDLITFLTECIYVLKNATMSKGTMTNGKEIKTDYGYVEDFIDGIKEELDNDINN